MKRLQTLPEHYLRFLLAPAEAQLSSYLARGGRVAQGALVALLCGAGEQGWSDAAERLPARRR